MGSEMPPATPAEMATVGEEGCVWHISAVHRVFSLSGEGEDYKVCRFSNTCCAELGLVLQGYANGGEITTVHMAATLSPSLAPGRT